MWVLSAVPLTDPLTGHSRLLLSHEAGVASGSSRALAADEQQKRHSPDPLHPVHRHEVGRNALRIGPRSTIVAIAIEA